MGAQVADTVVGLFVNPVVSGALVDLVDSLFGDFFGAQGVIAAVSTAASDIALAMIGGQSFDEALAAALGALKANADVVAAVGIAVGGRSPVAQRHRAVAGGRRCRGRLDHSVTG